MSDINLEELERLAKDAVAHSEEIGEEEWFSEVVIRSMSRQNISQADAEFIAAATPSAILELIQQVQEYQRLEGESMPRAIRAEQKITALNEANYQLTRLNADLAARLEEKEG